MIDRPEPSSDKLARLIYQYCIVHADRIVPSTEFARLMDYTIERVSSEEDYSLKCTSGGSGGDNECLTIHLGEKGVIYEFVDRGVDGIVDRVSVKTGGGLEFTLGAPYGQRIKVGGISYNDEKTGTSVSVNGEADREYHRVLIRVNRILFPKEEVR